MRPVRTAAVAGIALLLSSCRPQCGEINELYHVVSDSPSDIASMEWRIAEGYVHPRRIMMMLRGRYRSFNEYENSALETVLKYNDHCYLLQEDRAHALSLVPTSCKEDVKCDGCRE